MLSIIGCIPKIPPSEEESNEEDILEFETNIVGDVLDDDTDAQTPSTYHDTGNTSQYQDHWGWMHSEIEYPKV